jgi:hypothetical protein
MRIRRVYEDHNDDGAAIAGGLMIGFCPRFSQSGARTHNLMPIGVRIERFGARMASLSTARS